MAQTRIGTNTRITAIVLAAGKGTRMSSPLPKVLHPVAGIPIIQRVMNSLKKVGVTETRIVVGHGESLVRNVVEPMGGVCFKQTRQNGTADAVRSANPEDITGLVLILNGDHPLIEKEDLDQIINEFNNSDYDLCLVTAVLKNPKSFGRVVKQDGQLKAVVEAKDASHDTLKISEVNTGIYITRAEVLTTYLPQIGAENSQNEFYLTDIISILNQAGKKVGCVQAPRRVSFGVNSQKELSQATKYAFKKKAHQLMKEGVVIIDPENTYIEEYVQVGQASVIYPGVYIKGNTQVGKYCVIEPHCFVYNSALAEGVIVKTMSHLEDCVVSTKSEIGPYARLRPGTEVGEGARVGNFVELKKVKFGKGSKANHLTYLGDAEVGENVNIGCGTITCNYAADKKKYKTMIGDNSFVGSDTQFVAPVQVGKNAVIGSGSTITKNVPDGALAVARSRQIIKENYRVKSPKKSEE